MSGIEGGGVIRFEVETQHKAWMLFDLSSADIEPAIGQAVNEGFDVMEATINCRRVLMSLALGHVAKIPEMLRQGFEGKEEWWAFVDDQIAARDEARATMEEGNDKWG